MSNCSKCGLEIPVGAKFCMECGTAVPIESTGGDVRYVLAEAIADSSDEYPVASCDIRFYSSIDAAVAEVKSRAEKYEQEFGEMAEAGDFEDELKNQESTSCMFGYCVSVEWKISKVPSDS